MISTRARTSIRSAVRGVALLVVVGAGFVGLVWLGAPDVDWSDFGHWLEFTEPEDVVVTLVHLVALAVAGYLLVSVAAYTVAALSGIDPLVRAAGRVVPASVRRFVDGVLAVTIAVLPIAVAPAASARPSQAPPAATYTPVPAGDDDVPPASATAEPATAVETYVVADGDSLWSIAEATIESRDINASGSEVAVFWRRLVEENRESLSSGDPNLIFEGETIRLPPSV